MTTITWVNGIGPGILDATSGNWDDATAWSPQRVPNSSDDVFIGGNLDSATYTVTLGANDVCNSLVVNPNDSGVNLVFAQNGTLELANGGLFVGLSNGTGQITMADGSTLQVDAGTFSYSGDATFDTGTFAGNGTIAFTNGTQIITNTTSTSLT